MSGKTAPPPVGTLEPATVLRHFGRAAVTRDQHTPLEREVAARMLERLDLVRLTPARVLDLGCGTGPDLVALGQRYAPGRVVGVDASPALLARVPARRGVLGRLLGRRGRVDADPVLAEAVQLPFAGGSFGLVWSNFLLPWTADPLPVLQEAHRVLEVGGLLTFATLGPDTLRELRDAFVRADRWPHTHAFADMHDLGDALLAIGFADPVMDMEVITLTYADLDGLFADLRGSGAGLALAGRRRGLMSRAAWQRMREAYEAHRRDGRLPASFEIVYGHAWKVPPRSTAEGAAIVRFDLPRQRQRRG